MTTLIAYAIAGICATAFITLWFITAYKVLRDTKKKIESAEEQIKIHYAIYRQDRESPNGKTAKRMLDISLMIYRESLYEYNHLCAKLIYKIPGFFMGFHAEKEREYE